MSDDAADGAWFRAAVAPVLATHTPRDRWADLRRQVAEQPRLVVAVVPRRRRPPRAAAWLVAAALVVVALLAVVVAADDDGERAATTASSTSVAPSTATTEVGTTRSTSARPPLVVVPAVQRRAPIEGTPLDVRFVDLADATVPEGAVVSQTPAPGELAPEGSVVVVVMSGGGPVTTWGALPPEAKAFTDGLTAYQRGEPIRRVLTSAGEAFKVDGWLFGPCPTMPEARAAVLDPAYDEDCY